MGFQFNDHWKLSGKHAFLSPSGYSWIRYDEEKLITTWSKSQAATRGTELHAFASEAIRLKIKMDTRIKTTLNMYVNDVLGYRMASEQVLYGSEYCFGTADALGYFTPKKKDGILPPPILRIFDLKTGVSKASFDQLMVYAALFIMEYGRDLNITAFDIDYDLRIYQNDEILVPEFEVDPVEVIRIMDQIKTFTRILDERKAAGLE